MAPRERRARVEQRVEAVRRFNRFYTKQIGVLQDHLLRSPYSLTEARVLYVLAHHEQEVAAMHTIEALLGAPPDQRARYFLRPHRAGDMGWVVQRHGVLYAQEYGWDEQFEALVAEIVAKFMRQHDPKRERCWIAEQDGENIGSVFLVKKSEGVAQ